MKPGLYTTEFWLTVSKTVLSGLVFLGVIGTQDASTLGGALATAVTAVAALVTAGLVISNYIRGRVDLKDVKFLVEANELLAEASEPVKPSPSRPRIGFHEPDYEHYYSGEEEPC